MSDTEPKYSDTRKDDAIHRVGEAMAKMRLMTGRRYIGRVALARLGTGMELSDLDVMSLVSRLGVRQDITIGAIADNMRIDHSRASRMVADLVKRDLLRREASQQDARRTIVTLTDNGRAMIDSVHDTKRDVLTTALAGWPEEDIAAFAALFNRFTERMEEQANAFEAVQARNSKADD
ncbi:DNA-binding MarR family transcriptional regulator [Rhizobium sp. SG_E_25_P2]|uniref:MarR family winged helix-turn-helix transcriptional regulator n=1 Tax=Rhizobium sp. SG_E_25_P2 TaxID=2879942 RepID=UPI0024772222|nr:MarR family winged helix-turn-helix transcriptional regulator [Rhizobium sp. SG_E_25_P2]MDH6269249.1 DNA-binding MarR family transcriptional regulator [Rhizobium sp. SG_E_25_P2]